MFRNKTRFYGEELLAPRPTPKLGDHPLSAVRDCLFNIFVVTLHIGGRFSIRNLRTRHAVVTGTHRGVWDYWRLNRSPKLYAGLCPVLDLGLYWTQSTLWEWNRIPSVSVKLWGQFLIAFCICADTSDNYWDRNIWILCCYGPMLEWHLAKRPKFCIIYAQTIEKCNVAFELIHLRRTMMMRRCTMHGTHFLGIVHYLRLRL